MALLSELFKLSTNPVGVTDSSEIDLTITGQNITASLANSGVTPGTYGSGTQVFTAIVDAKGRITSASNTTIAIPQSAVTNLVDDLGGKQATLVSGTNIKTINSESILGSGNLEIAGGGLSNGVVVNGVANFWQNTPPTTRVGGGALVDGDVWYQTGVETWIKKGAYWVSQSLRAIGTGWTNSVNSTGAISNTDVSALGSAIYAESVRWSVFLKDRDNDATDYWTINFGINNYGDSTTNTNGGSINTIGLVHSSYFSGNTTPNAFVFGTVSNGQKTSLKWWTRWIKTGSNTNRLSHIATLYYRTVYDP